MKTGRRAIPGLALRIGVLVLAVAIARLDHNPIILLEARLGLSPSPLERIFGIRGVFSGMSEAAYRASHGDVTSAMAANTFFIPLALVAAAMLIAGWRPRVRNRRDEVIFLGSAVVLTLLLNVS